MDAEQIASRPPGIPRLSRLPRATTGAASDHTGDLSRVSRLPKATHSVTAKDQIPSVSSISSKNIDARFGWRPRNADGTRQSNVAEQVELQHSLPTTVGMQITSESPKETLGEIERASQHGHLPRSDTPDRQERRKPRPSLSDRTIETMAQVPPSPSPSRNRSSVTANTASMLPPPPPSSFAGIRSPQSNLTHTGAYLSPNKPASIAADQRSTNIDSRKIQTPSRIQSGKVSRTPASAQSSQTNSEQIQASGTLSLGNARTAHRAQSLLDLRASMGRQPTRKVSLNFRDIPSAVSEGEPRTAPMSRVSHANPNAALRTGNTPSKLRKRSSFFTLKPDNSRKVENHPSQTDVVPNSSVSLRETIAKAKAAKRQDAMQSGTFKQSSSSGNAGEMDGIGDDTDGSISFGSLKSRIKNAVNTGTLNIAALDLKEIPREVLCMYDTSGDGHTGWAEAVDLTKVIAADNEIEVIPDDIFPDWTISELQNDDDKSNIFGGLEVLDLHGNHISGLPIGLRRLERLSVLNLSNNKLTCAMLDVICQISSLRDLSLGNNELQGALPTSLSQLEQLHTLNVHSNKITDISSVLVNLSTLRKLDISNNQISSLPLLELGRTSLTELNAARNKLSGPMFPIGFVGLPSLQTLNVSNNRLTIICEGSSQLPQLQSLIADNNQLSNLGVISELQSLVTLTASNNQLEDLPEGFVRLHSLRAANFSYNNIKVLDPYISKMENLAILEIAANPLKDRKYLTLNTADLKAELAKRLTAVYINGDHTAAPAQDNEQNVLPSSSQLKSEKGVLDMSTLEGSTINMDSIEFWETIHTIKSSHNQLEAFSVNLLEHPSVRDSLKVLDLSHSTVLGGTAYLTTSISLPNLRVLSLANSSLASIDALTAFLQAPQLTDLNISCNRLNGPLPCMKSRFGQLTTLLASDNEFTSITPDSITGLEVVDVRNNNIEFLPPKIGELGNVGDQRKPGRLRTFDCAGNKFRVPRLGVVERGTEAILKDLRRMVITDELGAEWRE